MKKRNFKKILLILLSLSAISNLTGQERVNRPKLTFNSTSEVITKAIGWSYNSKLGEWIDYANTINDDKSYKTKYKTLLGSYMMSHNENFISIKTKSLIYDNVDYYILIIEKWKGSYEYPAIMENWREYKQINGYIFTKSEYMKLQKLEENSVLITPNLVYIGSLYEKYDETKFLDLIQTELSKNKSESSIKYAFNVTKTKEGKIRFLVDLIPPYSDFKFDKQYFETDIENFSKIIIK
ncbi:hypothetical protein [Flavobacterium mesophilum]|uniref:hypothetical protein n=1 Tax=Flavobacterium mesophilum TaxID=3143495 RepID=UPI0031DFEFAA